MFIFVKVEIKSFGKIYKVQVMSRLKVFMVMPFSNKIANDNYSHSISPICEQFDLEIRRADEIFSTSQIYDDIINEIQNASIIIVDISQKNPNVYYELGIAHTLKQKRTIIVTQDEMNDLPFDIRHFRIIPYEDSIASRSTFEKQLRATLEILLSDSSEIFKDEFSLTLDIFQSSNKHSVLCGLVGLIDFSGVIHKKDPVNIIGKYQGGESIGSYISAIESFKSMEKLGHICFENDILVLTEKGKAFINFLMDNGIECYQLNDQKYKDYEVPLLF